MPARPNMILAKQQCYFEVFSLVIIASFCENATAREVTNACKPN